MDFARVVADRVIFMDVGQIVEEGTPNEFSGTRAMIEPSCSSARY